MRNGSTWRTRVISSSVLPRAPAETIESEMAAPTGEQTKFLCSSLSFSYRSKPKRLLACAAPAGEVASNVAAQPLSSTVPASSRLEPSLAQALRANVPMLLRSVSGSTTHSPLPSLAVRFVARRRAPFRATGPPPRPFSWNATPKAAPPFSWNATPKAAPPCAVTRPHQQKRSGRRGEPVLHDSARLRSRRREEAQRECAHLERLFLELREPRAGARSRRGRDGRSTGQ